MYNIKERKILGKYKILIGTEDIIQKFTVPLLMVDVCQAV